MFDTNLRQCELWWERAFEGGVRIDRLQVSPFTKISSIEQKKCNTRRTDGIQEVERKKQCIRCLFAVLFFVKNVRVPPYKNKRVLIDAQGEEKKKVNYSSFQGALVEAKNRKRSEEKKEEKHIVASAAAKGLRETLQRRNSAMLGTMSD